MRHLNAVDPKTLELTISALKGKFHTGKMVFIADRAFVYSKSLEFIGRKQYIIAAYRCYQPHRNILIHPDFTNR
jgi:hypothetical protein